jgi:hypothetical protein
LCRRDGGILAKSDDIWLSGRHVADMSATFSAKRSDPPFFDLTAPKICYQ